MTTVVCLHHSRSLQISNSKLKMNEKGEENAISTVRTPKEDENAWVFESLVGFLSGLVWSIPITNFIETKCQDFDPLIEGNEKEREKIYEEYKQMVDLLLSCFMQDLGIKAEQFEQACYHANIDAKESPFHKSLFEQIWAAEDYDAFVRVMTQKNTELQLQALLGRMEGEGGSEADRYEDSELQRALWQSFEEHQESLAEQDRETKDMKRVLADTLEEEKRRLEAENLQERELLQKAIALSMEDWNKFGTHHENEKGKIQTIPNQAPLSQSDTPEMMASGDNPTSNTRSDPPEGSATDISQNRSKTENISEEEVAKRRAYLNQQRDKLLAQKRKEHKKQLADLEEASKERPKSARMAMDILENTEHSSNLDVDALSARKALAARLRAEVVAGRK